jgi:3-isopropylmalate/(R)-2-methylmalate dehydratase small subunit
MSDLNAVLRGRVWKFGDSVDTNQLAGGGLAAKSYEEGLRINCLRGLRPDFNDEVRPGDIVVAGTNFGCGSSRQSAVQALQCCGISVVLAESVARIHRRNSIALGLPTFALPGIAALVDEGDEIEVDYPAGIVRNATHDTQLSLPRLPASVEEIYEAGGLVHVIARRLAVQGIVPPAVPVAS